MGLLELAERCEVATEPTEELTMEIVRLDYSTRGGIGLGCDYDPDMWMMRRELDPLTSIDAAMVLVPEGLFVTLIRDPGGIAYAGVAAHPDEVGNPCASLPLALTAAALRARHALALSKGSDV